jgi:hypothetical protein
MTAARKLLMNPPAASGFDPVSYFYDYYDYTEAVGTSLYSHNGLLDTLTGVTINSNGVEVSSTSQNVPAGISALNGFVAIGYLNGKNPGQNVSVYSSVAPGGFNVSAGAGFWVDTSPNWDWSATNTSPRASINKSGNTVAYSGESVMLAGGATGADQTAVAFPDVRGQTIVTANNWTVNAATSFSVAGINKLDLVFVGICDYDPVASSDWTTIRDGLADMFNVALT